MHFDFSFDLCYYLYNDFLQPQSSLQSLLTFLLLTELAFVFDFHASRAELWWDLLVLPEFGLFTPYRAFFAPYSAAYLVGR